MTLSSLWQWNLMTTFLQNSRNSPFSRTCSKTMFTLLRFQWLVATVAVTFSNLTLKFALLQSIIACIACANITLGNSVFSTYASDVGITIRATWNRWSTICVIACRGRGGVTVAITSTSNRGDIWICCGPATVAFNFHSALCCASLHTLIILVHAAFLDGSFVTIIVFQSDFAVIAAKTRLSVLIIVTDIDNV